MLAVDQQKMIEAALAIRHFIVLPVPSRAFPVRADQVSYPNPIFMVLSQFFYIFPLGTQALVRSGSPNSSLSADDRATIVPICRAKAVVDSTPFPYEKDALKFKVKSFSPSSTLLSIFQHFLPLLSHLER